MTPKEKAEQLVKRYSDFKFEIGSEYEGYITIKILQAKLCALITVDEIIDELTSRGILSGFWYEVHQEIKKI
jgi:hypothetical protein